MDGGAASLTADAPAEGSAVERSEPVFDGTAVNLDDEHKEEPPEEEEVVPPVKDAAIDSAVPPNEQLDGLRGEDGNEDDLEIGTEHSPGFDAAPEVAVQPGEESQVISLEDPSVEQSEVGMDGISISGIKSEVVLQYVNEAISRVFGTSACLEASYVAGGEVLPESVTGIAGDGMKAEDELRDSVEVEVFEESLEPPQDEQTDPSAVDLSGHGDLSVVENGDLSIEDEKFDVQMDGEVIDSSHEESEIGSTEKLESLVEARVREQSDQELDELELKSLDSLDSEGSGSFKEAQEGKTLDELDGALDEQHGNMKKGSVPAQVHGLETNGLTVDGIQDIDSSSIIVDDGEFIIGEQPAIGIINGKKLDDLHAIDHKGQESGDAEEQILDGIRINHDSEFKETRDEEIGLKAKDANEQRDDLYDVLVQSGEESKVISFIGGSKDHSESSVDKIYSSSSKPEVVMQSENEPVAVEDLYYSSSSDDDDKVTSSQPAPSIPSNAENPGGGLALPSQPAGLGSSVRLLEPSARPVQQPRANGSAIQRQTQPSEEPSNEDAEDNNETREKLQAIRVKFLRLAHRLGQTPHNVVVAQVLYRLGLAEQLRRNTNSPGVFSFDRASVMAEQLEATGHEPLDFSCTIMVIGKTGVGKSATINSIFDEVRLQTDAFLSATRKTQEVVGTVQGLKVRVIDTPGLSSSSYDQSRNEKILHSVKRFISKTPPDIVLYFDRLDMQTRDHADIPQLRTITDIFGASIWFNAIIVLTHAASAPPDGPNGNTLSYEMFVTQRTHVVQQAIRQAAGDVRLMNPVSLVENHSACRMNRAGQRVLPNGQVWKPQLLLLSFASKILAEANMLLRLQDGAPGKPFGRARAPPLPFLLSSLLQSRPQVKLPEEQFGDDEEDLDQASDSDSGSDYDELPPFKRLTKSQLSKLNNSQKKAYFEELDYREKLFYKKQLKEERERRKLMKKIAAEGNNLPNDYDSANIENEDSSPPSVPVPMPDFMLPSSFDSDCPSHRYCCLNSSSQWLVRPVLETQGWDHDVGYEGLNAERLFVVKEKLPVSVSGQLTKDKKEFNLQTEVASSIKHGEGKTTSLGLELQSVGKDMAYTVRGETRIRNFRRNNTAAGFSSTLLGDSISTGLKIEDKLAISNQLRILISGGAMSGRGDVAYGGRLELTLRDRDYPIGRMLSTLALSVVDWRGDLAVGCNVQSQFPVGRATNLIGHVNISNKGTGQVGIRLNSSDQLQIALIALVPILGNIRRMLFSSSESV